jgi:hypothetical protein
VNLVVHIVTARFKIFILKIFLLQLRETLQILSLGSSLYDKKLYPTPGPGMCELTNQRNTRGESKRNCEIVSRN